MHNLWLIARNEYIKKVTKKSFWLSSLSIPLLIIIVMVVVIFFTLKANQTGPLGYVDLAGLIHPEAWKPAPDSGSHIQILAYASEAEARTALENGQIQGYYLIPKDYLATRQLDLYYLKEAPGPLQKEDFTDLLRASLAYSSPEIVRPLLENGPLLTVQSADGSKKLSANNIAEFLLPFIAGAILIITNTISASSLLLVVAEEKENRTIEVLLTSLSPEQLIGGKVVGLMAVTFTQVALWGLTVVGSILVGSQFINGLKNLQVPWEFFLLSVLFFVPTYALIAGIMTAIGGSVTEVQQGQQIMGLLNMVFMAPLMLSTVIMFNPNSPLVVAMTLFPTTAFATIVLRWGFAVIPLWELVVSWLLVAATAVVSVWASARIFRLGMLRFGSALDLRTALAGLRIKG